MSRLKLKESRMTTRLSRLSIHLSPHLSRPAWAALVLVAALGVPPALAASKADAADALTRYQRERAACMSGQSNQDRTTCLREAGAAYAQAKQGALDDGTAQYAANARQRCEKLPDDDRKDCLARMKGQGTTSGSVADGGIYRELVTREVAVEPSRPASAAPATK
jgi:hypothetical protein